MKKKRMFYILIPLFFVIACVSWTLSHPKNWFDNSKYSITTAYDYPIAPESDEWKTLSGFNEIVAACQIPEDILYKMNTKALVESVVDCPIIVNMFAHNTVEFGFYQVKSYFNGLSELCMRNDAVDELKKYGEQLDSEDILSVKVVETLIEYIGKEHSTPDTESVFDTNNICKIVFSIGPAEQFEVQKEDLAEITQWLETFKIGKKVKSKALAPGTNSVSVQIEYTDGTVIENGLSTMVIDGKSYYLVCDDAPESYLKLYHSVGDNQPAD